MIQKQTKVHIHGEEELRAAESALSQKREGKREKEKEGETCESPEVGSCGSRKGPSLCPASVSQISSPTVGFFGSL